MDKVLLITGGIYHDFEAGRDALTAILAETGRFEVTAVDDPGALKPDTLAGFDAVLLYINQTVNAEQTKALADFVAGGKALVGVHSAICRRESPDAYLDLIGAEFTGHGPPLEFAVTIDDPDHDVTCRTPDFRIHDELYTSEFHGEPVQVLASAHWQGRRQPMVYVKPHGAGRVVGLLLGHDAQAMANRDFRRLLVHALDWAVGRDETREIGVGLIGYGPAFKMGKQHGSAANATRGLRTVAACDINPACLETARADFPGIATYDTLEKMLEDDDVNLCVIILPHHLHGPVALQCLKAGRHVALEKPFCLTVDEATAMIEAARAGNLALTVYHNRRFDGDFLTIRRAIEAGLIGEVFQVHVSMCAFREPGTWWRSSKAISGGLLYDWGAHLIDWLLHFLPGKVEGVTGFLHKRRWWHVTNEDHGLAVMRFEGGRTGLLEMSSMAADNPFRWRILGTKGAIVSRDAKDIRLTTEIDGQSGAMQLNVHDGEHVRWYYNLAEHLLRGAPLEVTPEQARRVIAILEATERSSETGAAEPVAFEDDFALKNP